MYSFFGIQNAMRQLIDSGRYDTHKNFTVVLQPFMRDVYLPRLAVRADTPETFLLLVTWNVNIHSHLFLLLKDGRPDRSYFAPDCFHLSQKAHTLMARALWNNMVGVLHFSSVICVSVFTPHIVITGFNAVLVRTSGKQNIYAGFWSRCWFEVSL